MQNIAYDKGKDISVKVPKNYVICSEKQTNNYNLNLKRHSQKLFLVGNTELLDGLRKTIDYYEEV